MVVMHRELGYVALPSLHLLLPILALPSVSLKLTPTAKQGVVEGRRIVFPGGGCTLTPLETGSRPGTRRYAHAHGKTTATADPLKIFFFGVVIKDSGTTARVGTPYQ